MNLKESIESVRNNFRTDSDPFPTDSKSIELLYVKYLGRKGLVSDLFSQLINVSNKERPSIGKNLKWKLFNINNDKLEDRWSCKHGKSLIELKIKSIINQYELHGGVAQLVRAQDS